MSGTTNSLRILIAAVLWLGAAIFTGAVLGWEDEDGGMLVAMAVLAATCEVFDFAPFPNSRISLSIAPILAAAK